LERALSNTNTLSLEQLFEGHSLFVDKDDDGYPDGVNLRILIHPLLNDPHVWVGILNLTARLAFEVLALNAPILHKGQSAHPGVHNLIIDPLEKKGSHAPCDLPPAELYRVAPHILHLRGSSPQDMMALLNAFAVGCHHPGRILPTEWQRITVTRPQARHLGIFNGSGELLATHSLLRTSLHSVQSRVPKRGQRGQHSLNLLNLVEDGGLFKTVSGNPRAIETRMSFHIENNSIKSETGLALSRIVSSIALYATKISLPLVYSGMSFTSDVIVQIKEEDIARPEIRLMRSKKESATVLKIRGKAPSLAKALMGWFDWAMTDGGPGSDAVDHFRNRVTAFQELIAGRGYWGQWAQYLTENVDDSLISIPQAPPSTRAKIARACRALSLPVPPPFPKPKNVYRLAHWKGEEDRVLQRAKSVPVGEGDIFGEILVSRPLGQRKTLKFHVEKILRERGYHPNVDVFNAYKPAFSWLLEHILPKLEAQGGIARVEISYRPFRTCGKVLEMRSRWLQEIYPGPEVMALRLKLKSEMVLIKEHARQKAVYRVKAWDEGHGLVLDKTFSPPWTKMAFLATDTSLGFVHPTTGRIRLWQANRILLQETVPTDREKFWRIFQDQWLPLLEEKMTRRLLQQGVEKQPAFWQEIVLHVTINETDEKLDFGEERICPLEALHEDLYFVFLEAYAAFSKRHKLPSSIQLGQIIPILKIGYGTGSPSASLKAKPFIWGEPPATNKKMRPSKPVITTLSYGNGLWHITFRLRSARQAHHVDGFVKIARAWGFHVDRAGKSGLVLRMRSPRRSAKKLSPPLGLTEPPKDRLLSTPDTERWLKILESLPNLHVWEASRSWQGRPLHVIETTPQQGMSVPKLRLLKPTLFFNARHHANEVSSTNAALNMAWFMAATKEGLQWLKKVNVVWIPLENPDGVATFERLLPLGENHKLHAARYNALGAEFYSDYFEPIPRFGEARAKPRLWRRWQPEIMVDHHGVPSHEWNQPFSGYAPFRFREFWIPRTFVFVYLPFIDETAHPLHGMAHRMAGTLRTGMAKEEDILIKNRTLAALYRKYALTREPKVFPPSNEESVLILPTARRIYRNNFAVRYPEITKCEMTVEVPDEVVHGSSLEACVRAHIRIQKALITCLSKCSRGRISRVFDSKTGQLTLSWMPGKR